MKCAYLVPDNAAANAHGLLTHMPTKIGGIELHRSELTSSSSTCVCSDTIACDVTLVASAAEAY